MSARNLYNPFLTGVLFIVIIHLFFFVLSDFLYAQAVKEGDERLRLVVTENPEDLKRPVFTWQGIPNAEYQLYISQEAIYSGPEPRYPPSDPDFQYDELAYGYYQAYVIAIVENEYIRGDIAEFKIGMSKPELIYPEDKTVLYTPVVNFQWGSIVGATSYEVYMDQDMIYSGPNTHFEYPVKDEDYAQHMCYIRAVNEFQTIRSDRCVFKLERLQPPSLTSPEEGFSEVLISEEVIPTLEWEPVDAPAEHIEYELYINDNPKPVWRGSETSFFPQGVEIGEYKWQVQAIYVEDGKDIQKSGKGEGRHFTMKDKKGFYVGAKIGAGFSSTTNPFSEPYGNFSAGGYIEKRFMKSTDTIQFRLELDVIFDTLSSNFNAEVNYNWRQDFRYSSIRLSAPLLAKFYLYELFTKNLDLYPYAGLLFSFRLSDRLTADDRSDLGEILPTSLFDVSAVNVGLALGIGFTYTFSFNFLFQQKFQIIGDIRFQQAFNRALPESSFFGDGGAFSQFLVYAGTKIYDF